MARLRDATIFLKTGRMGKLYVTIPRLSSAFEFRVDDTFPKNPKYDEILNARRISRWESISIFNSGDAVKCAAVIIGTCVRIYKRCHKCLAACGICVPEAYSKRVLPV